MLLKELLTTNKTSQVTDVDSAARSRTKNPDGSYVGLKFDDEAKNKILTIAKELGIEDISPEDLHVTLVYTYDYMDGFKPEGKLSEPIEFSPVGFDLFGDENDCLVLKLASDTAHDRHQALVKTYGVTPTYSDYKPHVTLSYNWRGEIPKNANDTLRGVDTLKCSSEYYEDLQLNWAEDRGKK